jgi:hypothetical protein
MSERENGNIRPDWVTEQINRMRRDGSLVCVKVIIKDDDIDLSFATSGCSGLGGGSRSLTEAEKRVADLWRKLHLSDADFAPGNLVAFLKQLGL